MMRQVTIKLMDALLSRSGVKWVIMTYLTVLATSAATVFFSTGDFKGIYLVTATLPWSIPLMVIIDCTVGMQAVSEPLRVLLLLSAGILNAFIINGISISRR